MLEDTCIKLGNSRDYNSLNLWINVQLILERIYSGLITNRVEKKPEIAAGFRDLHGVAARSE